MPFRATFSHRAEALGPHQPGQADASASNRSEIVGIIHELGEEEEFTIEKDGEIVFQNKAGDLPKVKYRMSYPGKAVPAHWSDLELKDRVSLETYYDTAGQIESRILNIFHE